MLAHDQLARVPEKARAAQVHLPDAPAIVQRAVADRRVVVQVRVAGSRGLEGELRLDELGVLRLELRLVDGQIPLKGVAPPAMHPRAVSSLRFHAGLPVDSHRSGVYPRPCKAERKALSGIGTESVRDA